MTVLIAGAATAGRTPPVADVRESGFRKILARVYWAIRGGELIAATIVYRLEWAGPPMRMTGTRPIIYSMASSTLRSMETR